MRGRRSRRPVRAGRRVRGARGRDRAASGAGRHPDRRRLGEGGDRARCRAASCRRACISFRATRSRAPSIRARSPGFAELFDGRWCVLTPPAGTDPAAVDKLKALWEALGSHVEIMAPEHHDLVLAITSHVPHLIAYNIVNTAAHLERVTDTEVIKFSAGGFRDFTRIAASDPTMWRDVFLNNKEAVLEMLARFTRGSERAAAGHPLRRRAGRCSISSRRRAPSAAASSRPARIRPRPISAAAARPRMSRRGRGEPWRGEPVGRGPRLDLRLRLADVAAGVRGRGARARRASHGWRRVLLHLLDASSRHHRAAGPGAGARPRRGLPRASPFAWRRGTGGDARLSARARAGQRRLSRGDVAGAARGRLHREVAALAFVAERAHPSYAGPLPLRRQVAADPGGGGAFGPQHRPIWSVRCGISARLGVRERELERLLSLVGPHFARDGWAKQAAPALIAASRRHGVPVRLMPPCDRRRFNHRRRIAEWALTE